MASAVTMFSHLQIPLEEVVKATNSFDDKYVIGEGDFGKVYRGQLLLSGKMVNIAARRLDQRKNRLGEVEFWTEISVLASLEHENIVSLVGFCDEKGEKIIINKREATKGSLSMYLGDMSLTWIQRLKICVGVARALRYIHNGDERGYGVIHRNINSWTVLLDDNREAKLSGFEFSIKQSIDRMDRVVLSEAIGTTGYMDPETEKTGGVTHKSDIYSFGVVLCEILCARKAFIPDVDDRFLAPLFKIHYPKDSLDDIIHPDLRNQLARESLAMFLTAAYSCLKEDRVQRPNMNDIVIELEKALELQQELENLRKNLEHLKIRLCHMKIPLGDILLATDNFSEAYGIGHIGWCYLYRAELKNLDTPSSVEGKTKGELSKRINTVVIKRSLPREGRGEREKMFFTELEMLTTCKHPGIVKLLGFCDEGPELIRVVEHLSNGYLADYWENPNDMPVLTWATRLKICLDVAHGVNYLHNEMEDQKRVIHHGIKSKHIALDENWGAKIVDFSDSVFLPPNQDDDTLRIRILGTPGYVDPEYWESGTLKRESDVYSFGVVLFEVLCGRLAHDPIYFKKRGDIGLVSVARRSFQEGTLMEMIDHKLKEENFSRGPSKDSIEKFVKIAHQCIAETQDRCPTMKMVIQELQKALFFQEEHMQRLDMVQLVDEVEKSMEFKLTHEIREDKTQYPGMVQVVDEVKKSLELKLTNENSRRKLEHLKIPLTDILLATDNFSTGLNMFDSTCEIYIAELEHFNYEEFSSIQGKNKGELPRKRSTIVIKRFTGEDGEKMFFTEIEILTTCMHSGIVKLLGYCDEGSERILVVEHLPNGYLLDCLVNKNDMPTLTWAKRLKICLDVAHALNYLHTEMEDQKMIIHRDIHHGSIALDENWRAKIVDFRLSVFLPLNQEDYTCYLDTAFGTPPYMDPEYVDPEYVETRKLKRKSDVYSFGVVLIEVLCGRVTVNPIYLKEGEKLGLAFMARRCFQEGTLMEMIDPILKEASGENNFSLNKGPNKESLEIFIKIAHQCIVETQDQRPTMKVVIKELQKALFFQENNKYEPIISLEEIKLATQNFHDKMCIGGGGFGNVYRGKLPHSDGFNTIVAKRLDKQRGQGEQQFRNELQILFEYKHENVVRLVGYCDEKDAKIIVYEYASQGSLDRYLKDARLTWVKRLSICIDVATALDFIHGGAGKQAIVIHRDIKTANILLNDEWNAKLADFGLSLISPINKETDYVIDHACGTKGYLDPLYLKSGFLTKESDIYSFGVVLFEILCGRSTFEIRKHKGQYLPGFIKESLEKGKHDDLVYEALKEHIMPKALTAFQTIASQCLHDDREKRPMAKEVLRQLKEALEFQISGSD